MNKNSISKTNATRIIRFIRSNPSSTTAIICDRLNINKQQFQSSLPFVKSSCIRTKLEWYPKR